MTATSMSRMVVASVLVAVAGILLFFGVQHLRRGPPAETTAAITAPAPAAPVLDAPDPTSARLAAVQSNASALADMLAGSPPPPDSGDNTPSFDIARIEPSGEAVIAGRAAPGATVELLRNGEVLDRAVADQSGQFAMVPPPLPPGPSDLTLRSEEPDGKQTTSKQSVAVAVEPSPVQPPVVALMTPDKPTVVLSQPEAPKPTAAGLGIDTVEIEPGGKFHMSGHARPGAAVRLYLNNAFVAAATAAPDGRFAVTINEGVVPGNYRVRVDELESNAGAVRARAEVPFTAPSNVAAAAPPQAVASKPSPETAAAQKPQQTTAIAVPPDPAARSKPLVNVPEVAAASPASPQAVASKPSPEIAVAQKPQQTTAVAVPPDPVARSKPPVNVPEVAAASAPPQAGASKPADVAAPQQPEQAAAAAVPPEAGPSSVVVVPRIATTTVSRGDSLWRISRLSYGEGTRYAVIYNANREQIRNPDLIYPGQVFVLPTPQ